MLIKLFVENFLSIKNEIMMDLVATSDKSHPNHVVEVEDGLPLLRGAAIYGANAAGKSNLIKAVKFAQKFILGKPTNDLIGQFAQNLLLGNSTSDPLAVVSTFKLDSNWANKPSKFEFVIWNSGQKFRYGFSVDKKRVWEEWLFDVTASSKGRLYFHRQTGQDYSTKVETGNAIKGLGSEYRQFFKFLANGANPQKLFITEAGERNLEELKPVFNWFDNMGVITTDDLFVMFDMYMHQDKNFAAFVETFIRNSDCGIDGLGLEVEDFAETFLKNANILDVYPFQKPGGNLATAKTKSIHQLKNGDSVEFDPRLEESDGTCRLMHLAIPLFFAKRNCSVYFIDEIDRSLHPALSKAFINFFLNNLSKAGQIVFTTHGTHLLDQDLLRRDEVWFAEKDSDGASHFYSLSDFKIRNDLKLEKGYLQGRFGAVPFLGDLEKLGLAN